MTKKTEKTKKQTTKKVTGVPKAKKQTTKKVTGVPKAKNGTTINWGVMHILYGGSR